MDNLAILGVGYAFPPTEIDNTFLTGLSPELREILRDNFEVQKRHSVLPLSYIAETGNVDPSLAHTVALLSPTELAAEAAWMAIHRAGINQQEIGLVLGDSATPYETCPGEAPRVANLLGLKVPAYDLVASSAALAAQIHTVASWNPERTPRYVLCVTTNTPTGSLNYRAPGSGAPACARYGDAAAAVIVSYRVPGKLEVLDTAFTTHSRWAGSFGVDRVSYMRGDDQPIRAAVEEALLETLPPAISKYDRSNFRFIGPQSHLAMLQRLMRALELPENNHWYNLNNRGDTFGSGAFSVLAERWDETREGEKVLLAMAGPGLGFGHVLLRVR